MNEPGLIREMLALKSLAVLGLSDRPDRPSHSVSAYMQQHGYRLHPVNPAIASVLGEKSFPSLTALVQADIRPQVVNVFRAASFLPAIVDEMLTLHLTHLWVQQGIIDHAEAARAEQGGIRVIMDRCMMVEHRRLVP